MPVSVNAIVLHVQAEMQPGSYTLNHSSADSSQMSLPSPDTLMQTVRRNYPLPWQCGACLGLLCHTADARLKIVQLEIPNGVFTLERSTHAWAAGILFGVCIALQPPRLQLCTHSICAPSSAAALRSTCRNPALLCGACCMLS